MLEKDKFKKFRKERRKRNRTKKHNEEEFQVFGKKTMIECFSREENIFSDTEIDDMKESSLRQCGKECKRACDHISRKCQPK